MIAGAVEGSGYPIFMPDDGVVRGIDALDANVREGGRDANAFASTARHQRIKQSKQRIPHAVSHATRPQRGQLARQRRQRFLLWTITYSKRSCA